MEGGLLDKPDNCPDMLYVCAGSLRPGAARLARAVETRAYLKGRTWAFGLLPLPHPIFLNPGKIFAVQFALQSLRPNVFVKYLSTAIPANLLQAELFEKKKKKSSNLTRLPLKSRSLAAPQPLAGLLQASGGGLGPAAGCSRLLPPPASPAGFFPVRCLQRL